MEMASSARRTCRLSTSASEYTATQPTPSRRQVRMMRQAISPRFAIRILSNILASSPGPPRWRALFQEGVEPLARLLRGTTGRDLLHRLFDTHSLDRSI